MERLEMVNKVMEQLKETWLTKPELTFGQMLTALEKNINLTVYQLNDETLINVARNADLSVIKTKKELSDWTNSLTIQKVFGDDNVLMGWAVADGELRPLTDNACQEMIEAFDTSYEDFKTNFDCYQYVLYYDEMVFLTRDTAITSLKYIQEFLLEQIEELD